MPQEIPASYQRHALPDHHADDIAGLRAHGHTDADFLSALIHDTRHHAVESQGREEQAEETERAHQAGGHLLREESDLRVFGERHGMKCGGAGIGDGDDVTQGRDGPFGLARGADEEVELVKPVILHLAEGHIEEGPRWFGGVEILAVANHADDGSPLTENTHFASQRVLAVEEAPAEGLVDDHDGGGFGIVGAGEIAAGQNGNAHHVEIVRSHHGAAYVHGFTGGAT